VSIFVPEVPSGGSPDVNTRGIPKVKHWPSTIRQPELSDLSRSFVETERFSSPLVV
jgi:hypothetical protein